MGMLTANALEGYKKYTERIADYAKYKVGSTYYRAEITERKRLPDGSVALYILIDHTVPGDITVTQLQIYDTNNQLWLSTPVNIRRKSIQEGILYRVTIPITERMV